MCTCHMAGLYCIIRGWVLRHLYILGYMMQHFLVCVTRCSCKYMSEDNVIPYIEHCMIGTCHRVKLYHKGHKKFMYKHHRTLLYHRTLCSMSNKMFVYKYVKEFVYMSQG